MRIGFVAIICAIFTIACQGPGPHTIGDPGIELIFMVPGDRIQLDNNKIGYVDSDGVLVGIDSLQIPAAGRQMRHVADEIFKRQPFDNYRVLQLGERSVEVVGSVQFPKKYELPLHENWSITDVILQAQGFSGVGKREYLLIRRAWNLQNKYIFLRGVSLPVEQGIGGDDLAIFAGDIIIFPGQDNPVYVFGSVKSPRGGVCFTFADDDAPKLKDALEQAGGILDNSDKQNIQIFRVLTSEKRSRFKLPLARAEEFTLQPWDVVYVTPEIPKELAEQ